MYQKYYCNLCKLYFWTDSTAAQEIKLVYAIYHSYKKTDPELQYNTDGKKNHPVASIISTANEKVTYIGATRGTIFGATAWKIQN